MLEIIKNYWEFATTLLLGAIWIGRLSRDVAETKLQVMTLQNEINDQEPAMTILACGKQTVQCQNFQTHEFEEIKELIKSSNTANIEFIKDVNESSKQLIRESNKRSDDQHKLVMNHLLKGAPKE